MSRLGHLPNNKMAITGRNAWLCGVVSEQCIHEFQMFIFLDTSWWLRSVFSFNLLTAGKSHRWSAAVITSFVITPKNVKGNVNLSVGGRWEGSFCRVKDNFMSLTMFHLKLSIALHFSPVPLSAHSGLSYKQAAQLKIHSLSWGKRQNQFECFDTEHLKA